jgi:hypothetical protein
MARAIETNKLTNKGKWKGQQGQDGIGSSKEGVRPLPALF